LLDEAKAKLDVWNGTYESKESVEVLLEDWHVSGCGLGVCFPLLLSGLAQGFSLSGLGCLLVGLVSFSFPGENHQWWSNSC
jgi:hypothetical protein